MERGGILAKRSSNELRRKAKRIAIEESGDVCIICQKVMKYNSRTDSDHIIPLVRGGRWTKDNIRRTHFVCNRDKSFLTLAEYKVITTYTPRILFNRTMHDLKDVLGDYKKRFPDITEENFNKATRNFIEIYFPCLCQHPEEEKNYIEMYHPKGPLRWDISKELRRSQEFKDYLMKSITNLVNRNMYHNANLLNVSEVIKLKGELEQLYQRKYADLRNDEKEIFGDLERKIYCNEGYTLFDSNEIAEAINSEPLIVKSVIKEMINSGTLKNVRTVKSSFLKPN